MWWIFFKLGQQVKLFNALLRPCPVLKQTVEPVADPQGGRGGHAPPSPVKISHKKDGYRRQPHRFHVSYPIPYPSAGSATENHLPVEVSTNMSSKDRQQTEAEPRGWVLGTSVPLDCNPILHLVFIAIYFRKADLQIQAESHSFKSYNYKGYIYLTPYYQ